MKKTNQEINQNQTNRWAIAIILLVVLSIMSIFIATITGAFMSSKMLYEPGNIAIIKIHGTIMIDKSGGFMEQGIASSSEITNFIKIADEDPMIEAIIFDINSPGGTPVASYEIVEAIQKTEKTTVAWIREYGTSGAYWIASATDYSIANPISITGSIGVRGSYLDFSQFIQDYNITYQEISAGEFKEVGNPFKELKEEEKEIFQETIGLMQEEFITSVAENRNLSVESVREVANGMFYLGSQAKSYGLIDALGGFDEALEYVIEKEEIKNPQITRFKQEKTLLDVLSGMIGYQSFNLGLGIGNSGKFNIRT